MAKRQRQTENKLPENEPTSAVEINPVVALWFRPVKDVTTGATAFIDAHLMLADKELGLMPPNMYFFAAENSKRAEELNFIAIDQAAYAMDKAKTEWNLEPTFSLMITTRFLESDEKFNSLLAKLESMEIKRSRLILTFSALTVLHLGREVNTYLRRLREEGYTVALTDYAVDTAHFSLLFDYSFDILRIDADYLEDSYKYSRKKSAVEVLVAFAEKEEIKLIANGVTTTGIKSVMSELGLPVMCGSAVEKGTYKLEKACGIEEEEETATVAEQATESAFEIIETEAPEARASASAKIKNKTAVLEEEVAKVKDEVIEEPETEEPAEVEEGPVAEVEEEVAEEPAEEVAEPETEEPVAAVEEAEAEEPAEEVVEEAETEEPVEEVEDIIEEEQPEAVEEAVEEEQPEAVEETVEEEQPEAVEETVEEEQPEAVEETVEEEQPEVVEETVEEEQPEAVEEAVEEEPVAAVEDIIEEEQTEEVEEPTAEEVQTNAEENEAIANFLLATCMDFLTEEDIVAVCEGGLDALEEDKRRKVFEVMSEVSEEPREEDYQVYDSTGKEKEEIADYLEKSCKDLLSVEDLALIREEGLQALEEEKRKQVFEAMMELL